MQLFNFIKYKMKNLIHLTYLLILIGSVINAENTCDCTKYFDTHESTCPEIKKVEGGLTGVGSLGASWNCCKPSCATEEQAALGNAPKQCDLNMRILNDYSAKSHCDGGPATACISHHAFVIDGCENIGFGYGMLPHSTPNHCGKCFLLEFTGEGVWTTKDTHRALKRKNKKLILMGIHKGYDQSDGAFGIYIPGGGLGWISNCEGVFDTDLGAKYGGLLLDCQGEAGMSDDEKSNTERKKCLIRKCTEAFTGEPREGCLFYAYFLEAAGNPVINYQEVECPLILKDKY
jgi:hypothetical protein